MTEIVPGIVTWPLFAERFGYDFNGYCIRDERIAIDPVEMDDATLDSLRGVETIAITNRNHFRAAQKLKEASGARVLVHAADRAFVVEKGVAVDGELGDRVGPLVVVPAAGKSPGEVALYWPERKVLIVGDAVVGKAPGQLGLLPDKVIDDRARLVQSLRALAEIDFDTLLVCDGHSILSGARELLQKFVASL